MADVIEPTPQEAAIRRHRRWRIGGIIFVSLVVVSAGVSQWVAPADANALAGKRATVTNILSGDTLTITTPDGRNETVQLLGVVAPSAPQSMDAERYLTGRLKDKEVILQFDGTQTHDARGNLRALVYLTESDCINLDLVRDGHAYVDRRIHTFLQSQLGQAEGEARKKQRGMWSGTGPADMPEWRKQWLNERKIANDG